MPLIPFPELTSTSTTTPVPTTKPAPEPTPATSTAPTLSPSDWQAAARALPEVTAQLAAGQVIEAIKIVRQRLGIGLKDAKDVVEALRDGG